MNAYCPLCEGASEEVWHERQYTAYQCGQCAVVFVRPVPVHPEAIYDARYFERWYVRVAAVRKVYLEKKWRDLGLPLPAGGRLLDVGCGIGVFLDIARESGWEAVGQDVSPFAVQYCRRKGFTVFEGPLPDRDAPSGSFDVVTMWDVIAHLLDPAAYLRAAARLLKPGGTLVIKTPDHPRFLFSIANLFSCTGKSRTLLHIPAQIFHFDERSVKRTAESVGFRVLSGIKSLPDFRVSEPDPARYLAAGLVSRLLPTKRAILFCCEKHQG